MFKHLQIIFSRRKRVLPFLAVLISLMPFGIINSERQRVNTDHSLAINATYPSLSFSTYLGGLEDDEGFGIAADSNGSCYVTGNWHGDVFVAKYFTNGTLHWIVFLGGGQGDLGFGIAVASDGSCYVTGETDSDSFPTLNAYQNTYGGGYADAFVAKLSTNGTILWCTYLGGSVLDIGNGIAVSNDGSCYVTGRTSSSDFPILNAYNSTYDGSSHDAFVTKFSTNGSLLWSTYFGGSYFDVGQGIAVTSDGSSYVRGSTSSSNFPILNASDSTYNGSGDAFVAKFSANCSLLWSTFLGGSEEENWYIGGIAVAGDGSCYVTGETDSSDFPTLNAYDDTFGGVSDAFVAKFTSNGSLLCSTFLGGNAYDAGYGIATAIDGSYYITGYTSSADFPALYAYDSTYDGYSGDAFVSRFSTGGSLLWSTFLGGNSEDLGLGIAVDADSSSYITGSTRSSNFPTLNASDNTLADYEDAFVTKFIEVSDEITPTISAITHHPLAPTTEDTITISCLATDTYGIHSVTLYYKVNTASWGSKELTGGISNNYSTTIGPFNYNDVINYYIEAVDSSPNHNLATDDNNTQFYGFTIQKSTRRISAYGFLGVFIVLPILVLVLRKKRN